MGEFLRERAEEFLEEAEVLLLKKRYALSAFHFHQACELFLKYQLYLEIGDFPKSHSLQKLLIELGKARNCAKIITKFLTKNISEISDLEKSYTASRYFYANFSKPQLQKMRKLVQTLLSQFSKSK